MKTYEVSIHPQSRRDMITQLRHLADKASPQVAHSYLARIKTFCLSLATFPQRGTEKVRAGAEIVIENSTQPAAMLRSEFPARRTISECIALARRHEQDSGETPS